MIDLESENLQIEYVVTLSQSFYNFSTKVQFDNQHCLTLKAPAWGYTCQPVANCMFPPTQRSYIQVSFFVDNFIECGYVSLSVLCCHINVRSYVHQAQVKLPKSIKIINFGTPLVQEVLRINTYCLDLTNCNGVLYKL